MPEAWGLVNPVTGWLRARLKPLFTVRGRPHELALAFGLGVTLGVMPGTGTVAAAVCASVLRLNLPVMVAGSLLMNPLTAAFIYLGGYRIGQRLFGGWLPDGGVARVVTAGALGTALLSVAAGLVGYLLALALVTLLRARRVDNRQTSPVD